MGKNLKDRYESSPLFGGNAPFVEHFYEQYLTDPTSVDPGLRQFFESIHEPRAVETPRGPIEAALRLAARTPPAATAVPTELLAKQTAVMQLIDAYRLRGHLLADLDPLGLIRPATPHELAPASYGLRQADYDTEFAVPGLDGRGTMKLGAVIERLERIYRGTIGAELAHITSAEERMWLQGRFETAIVERRVSDDDKRNILLQLTGAEGIERYLHTRYVGQKRFSLEGGESLIPLIYETIQHGGAAGLEESVIGMAHRGRINLLVNVMGKSPGDLFSEFEGTFDPIHRRGSGDVKYHMGFSSDMRTPGGDVHLALAFNPSHLEIVNPVVEGSVRARQEFRDDDAGRLVLPILIHGDAAFAGQGVVMETFQMSQTRGFRTGGSIHVICNNQVGFTTSNTLDARSTLYCSDVAKMIEAPIFHVNGDDPEAVVLVTRLAVDYRMRFGKDVVIDLVCYRRHGHNEADEPAATQPAMYKIVRSHPTTRRIYAEQLASEGLISDEEAGTMMEEYRGGLDQGHVVTPASLGMIGNKYTVDWSRFHSMVWEEPIVTGLEPERIRQLARSISHVPDAVTPHPRVGKIMADRVRMAAGEIPMDWGFAESLAYASLLTEGYAVRIAGQDSGRGTFFHRHAVLHDQGGAEPYVPLQHVDPGQSPFTVIDSLLSEEAVLGFEYGFATTDPFTLDIWEGQFGDFVNGAQVVIDQFISSGESKWGRFCGLTMLLPHGYEGQGPEHSSARLERFLQLCAENNMQVCVPSTPSQIFHLLRRQMLQNSRKPLVVMTPKSLLRHRLAVSTMEELETGGFRTVLPDSDVMSADRVRRLVFCSGKVYYDLLETRRKESIDDVAIVRIEQLYPFPIELYSEFIAAYPAACEIVWCQEEPQNQGAWYQIRHRLQEPLTDRQELYYAGRMGAAAPAVGYYQVHVSQQDGLVHAALQGRVAATVTDAEDSESGRKNA